MADVAGRAGCGSPAPAGGPPGAAGPVRMLGPAEIRAIAARLGFRPSKRLGQNFVVDPGTVRRIAALAELAPGDIVLEVGPGFGSLTLALLAAAGRVIAVEIDPLLAAELPRTAADHAGGRAGQLAVVTADAARLRAAGLPAPPTVLAANLPYNAAVPVLLQVLAELPSVRRGLIMVQAEVAERLCAGPGGRSYGAPSAKLAWHATARRAGAVPRAAFWPVPGVDSGLVSFARREPPTSATREQTFAVIDAAFAQRRKTLRAALARWAGSADAAARALRAAGIDPGLRGESLGIADFARIAAERPAADRRPSG